MVRRLLFAILLNGCAAASKDVHVMVNPDPKPKAEQQEQKFDPSIVTRDPWIVQYRVQSAQTLTSTDMKGESGSEKNAEESAIGYRVQLFSTTDYHAALEFRDNAGLSITDNVYLDYEQPYYKVRVGNYADQESAEEAKMAARDLGFRDAWVIRTRILLKNH